MSDPESERAAARAALTAPERARAIEREQQAERELAPAEKRGIAATLRALVKPSLAAFGVRLP